MNQKELDKALAAACDSMEPDLQEIKRLIISGADTNQINEFGEGIFFDVFRSILNRGHEDADKQKKTVEEIKEVVRTMISNGWDIKRYGLQTMDQFCLSTYDSLTFEMYRFFLQLDLPDDPDAYEDILEGIGTEESYQRVCEDNHDLENLFFALYEMVDAKAQGKNYRGIEPYYGAEGMVVDRVLYFSETDTMEPKQEYTEYNADIGFVSGSKLLVLGTAVNILFMNDRIEEQPQMDISNVFGEGIVGETIESVSFDHRELERNNTSYGQPMIILSFSSGKKLKFTHNFGELPDNDFQPRFYVG